MARRNRIWFLTFLAVAVLCAIGAFLFRSFSHRTVHLTASQIKAELQKKFPYERRELVAAIRFLDPDFKIDATTSRVTFAISIQAAAIGTKPIQERATAEGSLRYESSTGDLFLDSSKVTLVDSLNPKPREDKKNTLVEDIIEKALTEYLSRKPLYRLSDRDSKTIAARRALRSIRIEDGDILIELGP